MTLTDWGVSRRDMGSLVDALLLLTVYERLASLEPSRLLCTVVASSCSELVSLPRR